MTRALVLGGGVVGIAWETGVLKGLRDSGVEPADVDTVVGTSAGSVVGTLLRSGRPLDDLHAEQFLPSDGIDERTLGQDLDALRQIFGRWSHAEAMTDELCAEIGALALAARTVSEDERLEFFRARMPRMRDWPERPLTVTAVDAESGAFQTWNRDSGVPLILAVASSCAVPGMFPPVTINGRCYIDGGVRSGTSADLARGHEAVLVLAPIGASSQGIGAIARRQLDAEVDALRSAGSAVEVILPDAAALEVFGPNLMDTERRAPAAEAGLRQATETAARLRSFWAATAGSAPS